MDKRCVICSSDENRVVFNEFETDMLECLGCGHIFSSNHVDQFYDKYFGEEDISSGNKVWWNEAHKKMYDDFCKRFIYGKSGRLLDVGCGLGYFVSTITSRKDWEVYGYEISRPAVDFAKTELLLKNVFLGKVEDSRFQPKFFDIITCWDVIEHIPDPNQFLSYLSSLLKDDGMLFMHTPNIKIQLPKARVKKLLKGMRQDVHYLEAKDHVNIYSMDTMTKVLNKNGLRKVEFIHLYPIQGMSGSFSEFLALGKSSWFYLAKALFSISFGRINIGNLFVIAKKE